MLTLQRCVPCTCAFQDREDKNAELLAYLKFMLGYKCYSHNVPLFNPDNFKQSDLDMSVHGACVRVRVRVPLRYRRVRSGSRHKQPAVPTCSQ